MSNKRNPKKEDENTAGKVVAGVAVGVAIAAGIGYLGSRLWNAWRESEQQEAMAASASAGSCCAETEPEPEPEQYRQRAPRPRTPPLAARPVLTLHDQLLDYYASYVNIQPVAMEDARKAVDRIRNIVNNHLQEADGLKSSFKVGNIVPIGSAMEGLAVVRPDQFDIMIPLVPEMKLSRKSSPVVSGLVSLQRESTAADGVPADLFDSSGALSPSAVVGLLAPILKKAVQSAMAGARFRAELSESTASLTVVVTLLDDHRRLTIDWMPAVNVGGQYFMPKRGRPNAVSQAAGACADLWQVCYAQQEKWSLDRFESNVSGHVMTLKILKAIHRNNPAQFGMLTSYDYKCLLFHALDDQPDSCDWTVDVIGERLIDLLIRLKTSLAEQSLPHYFESSINLLADVSPDACANLAVFIEKKLGNNDLSALLKKNY